MAKNPSNPRTPLQPADLFELRHAHSPAFSADGSLLSYVVSGAEVTSDEYADSLWLLSLADGTRHCIAPAGTLANGSVAWAPDGATLAFIGMHAGRAQIFRHDAATGEAVVLSDLPQAPRRLAWSPDGAAIAFVMAVPQAPQRVAGMPAPPPGAAWAEPPFITDSLVWRWDDGGRARPSRHHLFVLPSAGGIATQVSDGAISFGGYGGFVVTEGHPSWSADSRRIVISGRPEPDDSRHYVRTEIFAFDIAARTGHRLTDADGLKDRAAISPDGRHIACVGWRNAGKSYHTPQLLLLAAEGSEARSLTAALDRPVLRFAWEASGETLLLTYLDSGTIRLARIDLAGTMQSLATGLGSSDSAYLGLGAGIAVGGDGKVAYAVQDATTSGDIVVSQNGDARRVTDHGGSWLRLRAGSDVEERAFGKLQGFLVKPPGFDPAQRYPLILEIHGGPWEAWGPQPEFDSRLMAARGYLVLLLNPRGSAGYGQAFADQLQGEFPGDGITADLLGAVEGLAAEPFVDANRIYVSGSSAGGTMTAWLTAHSKRFRAAAACCMVSDQQSMALTTDMPRRITEMWFSGLPWQHRDEYWRRSPLRLVGQVSTPTLVLCGEDDWRTPVSQSEQYYAALKLQGVEAMFVRFPGEKHCIERWPSNRIAKVLAVLDWFDRHGGTP